MPIRDCTIRRRLIRPSLALAAALLGACNSGAASGERPQADASARASGGRSLPACLAARDVSAVVGLEVSELPAGTRTYGDNVICAYQGASQALGVFVTTTVGPAAGSEEVFSEMKESVRVSLGASAEPEAIEVGERGYAFGSMSRSEAAAVSGGRLYYAEVMSTASANIGDKKAAMVALERLM
jgi:hypothetical protein